MIINILLILSMAAVLIIGNYFNKKIKFKAMNPYWYKPNRSRRRKIRGFKQF